jgi:hypothetical protein
MWTKLNVSFNEDPLVRTVSHEYLGEPSPKKKKQKIKHESSDSESSESSSKCKYFIFTAIPFLTFFFLSGSSARLLLRAH